jgi:hypothetical protein
LLQRFDFGLHIPLDNLHEWVVAGTAHPYPEWREETSRQFDLAYQAAAQTASLYASAGFAVVIEQIIYPHFVQDILAPALAEHKFYKIYLRPQVQIAQQRNAARTTKDFDTVILDEPLKAWQQSLDEEISQDSGWDIIDSSFLTVEETVNAILKRIG